MVEAVCPFVTMVWENSYPEKPILKACNWDSHPVNCDIFEDARWRFPAYDQAVTALIEDFYDRGIDQRVLFGS
ncbi:MAG: hypothetical protein M2R45_02762 [Verrucomicrobia subdivision 3 bacterium]|nr:hypothetical protein [Limisphaerales bacterium]MCS1414311.1 hypothetical protein [Limisphaerales bacterium]